MRAYEKSHPWLKFTLDLRYADASFWVVLGECQSKIEHLAGTPLLPEVRERLHRVYLAKGVHATTAIEGNTLTEEQVAAQVDGKLDLPKSQRYLQQEIENVIRACNELIEGVAKSGDTPTLTIAWLRKANAQILHNLGLAEGAVAGEISTRRMGIPAHSGLLAYRSPPPEDFEYLLERLCEWLMSPDFVDGVRAYGEEITTIGASIVKAIVAHVYFVWIHAFGDGNGRTARLLELAILLRAGVPTPAIHLLSNHYNITRERYYRELSQTSASNGKLVPFLLYAIEGLRDGLREQVKTVQKQQRRIVWDHYVYEFFRDRAGEPPRRQRNLALAWASYDDECIAPALLVRIHPKIASYYGNKSTRTLTRDVHALVQHGLLVEDEVTLHEKSGIAVLDLMPRGTRGYRANLKIVDAMLPPRRAP